MNAQVPPAPVAGPGSAARLLPHAQLREDKVRGGWVVMGPERAWFFNATGAEIVRRLDGRTTAQEIALELAGLYQATPEDILRDVVEVLGTLRERGLAAW